MAKSAASYLIDAVVTGYVAPVTAATAPESITALDALSRSFKLYRLPGNPGPHDGTITRSEARVAYAAAEGFDYFTAGVKRAVKKVYTEVTA